MVRARVMFGLGLAPSIICQWAEEESYLPICQVTGPQTSVLALDPEVNHDSALALLDHSLGVLGGKPSKPRTMVDSEMSMSLTPDQLNCVFRDNLISSRN